MMWYQTYPKFLKMTSLLHQWYPLRAWHIPTFHSVASQKVWPGPPLLSWNYHSSYFWWPVAELGPYRHFIPGKTPSMTWLCWVVLGLQSPLSNSLGKLILILQECDIITSSHHWMLHQMMSICYQLPSGYVKIAIENEHRNSGFSQL